MLYPLNLHFEERICVEKIKAPHVVNAPRKHSHLQHTGSEKKKDKRIENENIFHGTRARFPAFSTEKKAKNKKKVWRKKIKEADNHGEMHLLLSCEEFVPPL